MLVLLNKLIYETSDFEDEWLYYLKRKVFSGVKTGYWQKALCKQSTVLVNLRESLWVVMVCIYCGTNVAPEKC